MILDAYYDSLRHLLVSGDVGKVIASVGFGTSEETNATELTDAVLIPVDSVELDAENVRKLRVVWTLKRHEANGMAIREIGLLTADGTLVARRTRSAIEKTEDMELGDSWELDV